MNSKLLRLGIVATILAGFVGLAGCSVNQATGERQLVLVGEGQELAIGKEAHQDIVAQMGLYEDRQLSELVHRIGSQMAGASERPELPWSFAVVDDPIVNAFALPGGYIYVSRGILGHFDSEAELAGVLGHEIGHVTARHGVEQMSKAQLANLGLGVAMIASEEFRQFGGLAQVGMQLLFLKFGRSDESQADELGLRYVAQSAWSAAEMPKVFTTLERVSGASGSRLPEWASTHPSPDRRAARLRELVAALPPDQQTGRVQRAEYLQRLDGLVFGEDPRQGYSIGRSFYHPQLEFRIEAPSGWKTLNQRSQLVFIGPSEDAVVQLDLARAATPEDAAREFFAQQGVERGSNWRPGFLTFATTPDPQTGRSIEGVVGFLAHHGHVFRLLGISRDDVWSARRDDLIGSVGSFRRLEPGRYTRVEPARIEIEKLSAATSLRELARRRGSGVGAEELATLNGLDGDARLAAGTLVKLVRASTVPTS